MTVKKVYDLAGSPTTWGVEDFADNIALTDSVVVERLKTAGVVVFCKTNVSVMLGDIQSYNSVYGTTSSPWDLARTPGGSTGGSVAALEAGLSIPRNGLGHRWHASARRLTMAADFLVGNCHGVWSLRVVMVCLTWSRSRTSR